MSALATSPFTAEQRAAIAERAGSRLLAANAGSGKTSVLVERFVEAVLDDGVPVGAILALTFTEKAAAELRERVRHRLTSLGRSEEARAADGAWIGTIHGFCARVLRSAPLAAGLDPRFVVLDEAAVRRLAQRAFERALDDWVAAEGAAAVDVAAAYGVTLQPMVLGAHAVLRSRGQTRPVLAVPAPQGAPEAERTALATARAAAVRALAGAGSGRRVEEALGALDACERVLAAPGVPLPADLAVARLGNGARGLDAAECGEYRAAWEALRCACADHHARPVLARLAALLERFGAAYARAKAARARVDFEDLELGVRDLLAADATLRERWAQRFALIMVDEFQDTNRLQLDILRALERDNLFAVGDEFQAIYGFRHADVTIFRERRAALRSDRVGGLAVNFRSREELLDVVNAAFAPLFGESFRPLVAGQAGAAGAASFAAAGGTGFAAAGGTGFAAAGGTGFAAAGGTGFAAAGGTGLAAAGAAGLAAAAAIGSPRRAGRRTRPPDDTGELRLFDPDGPADDPPVELLVCAASGWEDVDVGLAALAPQPPRRVEARLLAQRLRAELDAGRRPGDVVVLVRATASLRLLEQALEDQGLATYVVGGRGYWSQEQVRDGLAYLAALANPLDEEALYGVLASPFCGAGSDALVLLAEAGRESGMGAWGALQAAPEGGWPAELPAAEAERLVAFARFFAAERLLAERLPVEVLLERAVRTTGYDVATLARQAGERRLANLRKLMRLAREYERAEGRDLHGFLAYAAGQDVVAAREGEAPLESEGLDAIRLMTIHRAKGLEFPVVCVADLGRAASAPRERLLVGRDGTAGLRLATLAGGEAVPALGWTGIAAQLDREDAEEERRLLYVAATRASDKLILSASTALDAWPDARPGCAPADWLLPALLGDPAALLRAEAPERTVVRAWDAREARVRVRVATPETLDALGLRGALAPTPRARPAPPGTALPSAPKVLPRAVPATPSAAPRLSYSALGAYARCPYRYYLERVLRLPREPVPPAPPAAPGATAPPATSRGAVSPEPPAARGGAVSPAPPAARGGAVSPAPPDAAADAAGQAPPGDGAPPREPLDARLRGSLVHVLLEDLDFARPRTPAADAVRGFGASWAVELTADEVDDIRSLVAAFAASPLCARLAAASRPRREAPFAFALEPGGPLVTGFVDVLARTAAGGALIVDYKSDRLEGEAPASLVERDYATQRVVYALAALHDGAPEVEVAYCFLEAPGDPVGQTFTQRDVPALTERVLGLARGVLARDYPPTAVPHRELCGDCPGRPALCSWDEAMTLREPPDYESAGSFAGSGGPS